MIEAMHSYLCMCRLMTGMMTNDGLVLDKLKSQGQACDQGLTTTMVAGRCFFVKERTCTWFEKLYVVVAHQKWVCMWRSIPFLALDGRVRRKRNEIWL